jgi:hypothetical protein
MCHHLLSYHFTLPNIDVSSVFHEKSIPLCWTVFEHWPFLIEKGLALGTLLVLSLIVAQQVAKGGRSELSRKRRYTGLKMPINLVREMTTLTFVIPDQVHYMIHHTTNFGSAKFHYITRYLQHY